MPLTWYLARAEAWLELALGYQMTGQLDRAFATLDEAQREDTVSRAGPRARLAGVRCFIHWLAADLPGTLLSAWQAISAGQATDQQPESLGWGHYFFAIASYQRNDLDAAELHANAVQAQRHACHMLTVVHSAIVLALVHQARGRHEEARTVVDRVCSYLAEINREALLPQVQAFGAELAAMQGDFETAGHWAMTDGPRVRPGVMAFFYAPQLTLPKVLVRMNTPASRQQAAATLSRLHAFVAATHNTRFMIEVLALQALCHDAEGNGAAALQALEQAVALAQPGGLIRVFVDLGPAMAGLMERLPRQGVAADYVLQILHAFPRFPLHSSHPLLASGQLTRPAGQVESLTDRELDVLLLLAQRLSAKEIAQRLTISPGTVKRHIGNIYAKLSVNRRRDAVAAAIVLGILPPQP
ncbi:MAG: hypothetical protein IPK16_29145 [Anaerolineales bacterium]|nr:hypothetical protein [Anaerolineales bacterium]